MKEQRLELPDQVTLQCITLWQPWATWVRWGWKTIETRTHKQFYCLDRKRIGIHAGKQWDDCALDSASEFLSKEQLERTKDFKHTYGAIICTAYVFGVAIVEPPNAGGALIECETVRHGLFLHSFSPIDPPIQAKGSQGIWSMTVPACLLP
jgi:hypothetical protein